MASNRKFFVAGNWKTVDTVSHNVFCKQGLTKVPKIIRNDFSSSYGLKSPSTLHAHARIIEFFPACAKRTRWSLRNSLNRTIFELDLLDVDTNNIKREESSQKNNNASILAEFNRQELQKGADSFPR